MQNLCEIVPADQLAVLEVTCDKFVDKLSLDQDRSCKCCLNIEERGIPNTTLVKQGRITNGILRAQIVGTKSKCPCHAIIS
ncbi:hypothetical protein EYC84_003512 [Monilinia fructicola]|uniref:Uncharacterized protein n=1 Tax=Monilinia fructicola TaxID=38448 RepID=A0A5M9K234_MONFR|nr:hypothetical protein EYC84_003512 [Monilinia fructicola]